MFTKEVYVARRAALLAKMRAAGEKGIILFIGNAEAPAQYKDNCYKWRQDSSWLYYFGLDEPLMAAILDIDSGAETLFADDVEIDDIIWMGPQPTVRSKADEVGIAHIAPYGALANALAPARKAGRSIHYLAPSRYFNTLRLMELMSVRLKRLLSLKRKFSSPSSSASIMYPTFRMAFPRVWMVARVAASSATPTTSNMICQVVTGRIF